MFEQDMDSFIASKRKADKAEMAAAGGSITYKGHVITSDNLGLIYHINDERPNGYSAIEYAKAEIDRRTALK